MCATVMITSQQCLQHIFQCMPLGFLIPSFQPRIQAPSPASFPHSAHLLSLIPRPPSQPHSQALFPASFPGPLSSHIPRPSPKPHSQAHFPALFPGPLPTPISHKPHSQAHFPALFPGPLPTPISCTLTHTHYFIHSHTQRSPRSLEGQWG